MCKCKYLILIGFLLFGGFGMGLAYRTKQIGSVRDFHFPSFTNEQAGKKQMDSLNVCFVGNWPFADVGPVACDSSQQVVFMASGGGVYVFDVSDSSNPTKISERIHTLGNIKGLFYKEGYLYIATVMGTDPWATTPLPIGYLDIWDVSNPSSPQQVTHYLTVDAAFDVVVSDSFAYVACQDSGLRVINVSDFQVLQKLDTAIF